MRRHALLIALFIIAAVFPAFGTEGLSAVNPASLLRHVRESIGPLPWRVKDGYAIRGRFILKATGEEIPYDIRRVRVSNIWAADFAQENGSHSLRYVFTGAGAWVASTEITADAPLERLPYMARFDVHQLYDALLAILEKGAREPSFSLARSANEIYVRGKLTDGEDAIFILNTVEYSPRKVLISQAGAGAPAWMVPFAKPEGSCSFVPVPKPSEEFEIWLSDPVDDAGYRYARRMDFVEHSITLGTLTLESSTPAAEQAALFERPPPQPWMKIPPFEPQTEASRSSAYLHGFERAALRARLDRQPWRSWNRTSARCAVRAIAISWTGRLFPGTLSPRSAAWSVLTVFLGFLALLLHRRRIERRPFSWRLAVAGALLALLVLLAAAAARRLHTPESRSLMALHLAIRSVVTDSSFFAARTEALLADAASQSPASSMRGLGTACQSYAAAYDLIRHRLPPERRELLETSLFKIARPLVGAARGWISSMDDAGAIAAGLGITGLAIGYEPYTAASESLLNRFLESQLEEGLHRSGPGRGAHAMNSVANLIYALKHTGRADYYADPSFQRYVETTLALLSPAGTLPSFGGTNRGHSAQISKFFLQIADHMPEATGRECVAAHDRYWAHGRFGLEGWGRWIGPFWESEQAYYENPHTFIQYARALPCGPLAASSAILGGGRAAVLRSGSQTDALFLAFNLQPSPWEAAHRDLMAFDLHAHGSSLLQGPGAPHPDSAPGGAGLNTAQVNAITMNNKSQPGIQAGGITTWLLNQPLFDHLRARADKIYDYGEIQRDIVLIRPQNNQGGYWFMLDDVFVSNPMTSVQWHLHGGGDLAAGIGQTARWTRHRMEPPKLKPARISLEVSHPIGIQGSMTTESGVLYSHIPLPEQKLHRTTIEWTGPGRFATLMLPKLPGQARMNVTVLDPNSCRIGRTDWISLGSLQAPATAGPLTHVSECTLVRDLSPGYPALLMISGVECRLGAHRLRSDKPITVSLSGLRGGFWNFRRDTRVEIHSPDIAKGDRFLIGDDSLSAEADGRVQFTLRQIGAHTFSRKP